MKIILHINTNILNELVVFNKEIPYFNELVFFLNNILQIKKIINTKEILNKLDNLEYLNNFNSFNIKEYDKYFVYDNKIIKLDNNLYFNNNKFISNSNYKKTIYGKIILSEQNFDNDKLIINILENKNKYKNNLQLINKNLKIFKLLLITDRETFWISKFNQRKKNFKLLNNNLNQDNDIILTTYENLLIYKEYVNETHWNNLIIDINSSYFKKDLSYINNLKYKIKYLIINNYYLVDNYENILNLYFKNYDSILLDVKSLSNLIYINKFKLDKDIKVFNNYINLNNLERKEYDNYINKFKSFYQKNNISFVEDIYLRKFCCYPQKNLKINVLNYKNINKDIELLEIEGEYKKHINKNIKKIKNKKKCSICLNNININNVGITKCGHLFCYTCIHKCINYKNECPTCRHTITTNDIYYIKNGNNINKCIINHGLIDDLGTKVKKLISLVKYLKRTIIFSNFEECIYLLKNIFNQINIVDNQKKSVLFLDYNKNIFVNNNINNIIFLDPLYDKEKNLSMKYKAIFNQIKNKKINVYNLIINNTIEKEIYDLNKNILVSI